MVKKIFFVIAILSMLASEDAMAIEQVYDSKIGKFMVDVPKNWTAKKITEGCKISSDDNKSSMTLQIVRSSKSGKDVGQMVAKSMGMNVKENKDVKENVNFLDGDINGIPFAVVSAKYDKFLFISIWGGNDRNTMKSIYDSATRVKEIDLKAGLISDGEHAKKRCPEVLDKWLKANPGKQAKWYGDWETVDDGKQSLCTIFVKN